MERKVQGALSPEGVYDLFLDATLGDQDVASKAVLNFLTKKEETNAGSPNP